MADALIADPGGSATTIVPVNAETLDAWRAHQPSIVGTWIEKNGFTGAPGTSLAIPDSDGGRLCVVHGVALDEPLWGLAALPDSLPVGPYRLALDAALAITPDVATRLALGWSLGSYAFTRYKERKTAPATLIWPETADQAEVSRLSDAIFLARDVINTPAEDMGPSDLAGVASDLAARANAAIEVTVGDALLARNFPLIHAVGRASVRAPHLIDIVWGDPNAPKVTLVGKGVCFDSGGLDIKPSSGMRWMKKDLGGAATVLGLAQALIGLNLNIRLRVLIPAVENAISANAFRPGDIFKSRKGLTVEIGNTDAEGRLILADALTRAGELSPALTIDLATLTGAARVALGPEVIPFYTADEALAAEIAEASGAVDDPLWRMPLWAGYAEALNSDIADLKNDPDAWAQAGSVTAALFLKRFAPETGAWVHLDIFAWNSRGRPGWPTGAEAQSIRALFAVIQARYGARARA